ncbi:MAG: hypothetical protein D6743_11525 [Calditrichaeota bacterium]|nr:MAG: hypothetical protein D6743_11525 [Calditrichota bacterium]
MKTTLRSLIELQNVDRELHKLEAIKGDLPRRVKELKDELERTRTHLDQLKTEWNEARKMKVHWEGELKALQETQKKYQEQLYAVTSNREYDAITAEIDSMKEKIDEAETQIIENIEQEERLSKDVQEVEARLSDLEQELRERETELQEKIKATEKETSTFEKQRAEIISHITKPVLYQYERIRKGTRNTAVVEVYRSSCGGCFAAIPPQKLVEIRAMDKLILCESCGRILVYKNDNGSHSA